MDPSILLEITLAILIVAVTISFVFLFYPFLSKKIIELTRGKANKLGTTLITILKTPIAVAIFIIGINIAFRILGIWFIHQEFAADILTVIWGVWLIWVAERILHATIKWYSRYKLRNQRESTFLTVLQKVLAVIIYIVVALVVIHILGLNVTPFIASLGIGGITVALALQQTLSNYFSSIYLSTDKAIRIGDYIELENGVDGYVQEIGWRSVKLRTLTNNYIIIPNSSMAENMIKNFTQPDPHLAAPVSFFIDHDSDLEKVEKVAKKTAERVMKHTRGGAKDLKPVIRFKNITLRGIELAVFLKVEQYEDQYRIIHQFIKEIIKDLKKSGIEVSRLGRMDDEDDDEKIFTSRK